MARFALLLALLLSMLSLPIAAVADEHEEEDDFGRMGAYVIGRVKWATVDSNHPFGPANTLDWQSNAGMDVVLGWRETDMLAIEAEFEWITSVDGIEYGTWLLGVGTKFYAMTGRVQPYLVLGFNGMWAKVPDNPDHKVDWGFRQGIGLDFYLTRSLALTGEGTFTEGVGSLRRHYYATVGMGVLYRFGGTDF